MMRNSYSGRTINEKYELESLIRRTHYADVYRAKDKRNQKLVSVYAFYPHCVPGLKTLDYLTSQLKSYVNIIHPCISQVLDVDNFVIDGAGVPQFYFVEEGISNVTLKQVISNYRSYNYNIKDMLKMLLGLAEGAGSLGSSGLAVNTFNPDTIVYLNDVARLPLFNYISSAHWVKDFSQNCNINGVDLRYIAPEMIMGNSVLPANDKSLSYLFGILAFEIASGIVPFEANAETTMHMHLNDPCPVILSQLNLPDWYVKLVESCLAKDVSQRPTLIDVIKELKQNLEENGPYLMGLPKIIECSKYRVLFVEDNKIDQLSCARHAKSKLYSFEYSIAKSIRKAKAILASSKFDCIVSDYMLPDGTALDVLELAGDIPTIVVSGSGKMEVALSTLQAGAIQYIPKDVRSTHLDKIPVALQKIFIKIDQDALIKKALLCCQTLRTTYAFYKAENKIRQLLDVNLRSGSRDFDRREEQGQFDLRFMEQDLKLLLEQLDNTPIPFHLWTIACKRLVEIFSSGDILDIRFNCIDNIKNEKDIEDHSINLTTLISLVYLTISLLSKSYQQKFSVRIDLISAPDNVQYTLSILPVYYNENIIPDTFELKSTVSLDEFALDIGMFILKQQGWELGGDDEISVSFKKVKGMRADSFNYATSDCNLT